MIEPSVSGALVTLITPDNTELKLTQVTDGAGGYSIGPLHSNLNYEVSSCQRSLRTARPQQPEGDRGTELKLTQVTDMVKFGDALYVSYFF